MKKKIISLLLLGCITLSLVACGNNTNTNTQVDNNEQVDTQISTENKDTEKENSVLTHSDIDKYNSNKESRYLSAVIYNPDLTYKSNSKDEYNKYIVFTYDMLNEYTRDELLNYKVPDNDMAYVDGDFRVGAGSTLLSACVTFGDLSSPAISYMNITDGKLTHHAFLSPSLYADDYKRDTVTYGDNGYVHNADVVERVTMCVDECNKEGYKMYFTFALQEPLTRDQLSSDKVNEIINNKRYLGTASILTSLDNLDSVEKRIGTDNIALKDTIFLQDIFAEKMSTLFGLNVRDKESFIHSERDYVLYYDCENKVRVTFLEKEFIKMTYDKKEDYSYDVTKAETKESFSYKDVNNNEYEYMVSKLTYGINKDTIILIYKNKEFMGGVSVSDINKLPVFEELNHAFGLNN